MTVPPYLVRRLVIDPLVLVAAIVALASLPLWLIVASFVSRYVPGRWRPLRLAWFLFLYLALEALMIIALFLLWVTSGFGWHIRSPRFVTIHYRLAAWWLRRVMGSARRTFNLVIVAENDLGAEPYRPILVFCRHAGPGDSLLLVDALLNGDNRRPRIVLKDMLQLDPVVDVLLNRLPNRFIPSRGRAGDVVVNSIAELSAGLGPDGALVLFPEGGNFTPRRRRRAIEKLEDIGRPGLADRAREMKHVLPPKPAGALAAIGAEPAADVVFVGHIGLERLSTASDLWRGLPMDSHILARTWLVPAEDIPPIDDRELWLYRQWSVIDDWIDERLDKPPSS